MLKEVLLDKGHQLFATPKITLSVIFENKGHESESVYVSVCSQSDSV